MRKTKLWVLAAILIFCGAMGVQAQVMKTADLEKYAKQRYGDSKRKKDDKTNANLYDEQWEIAHHYPFVEKDSKKRTCAKALVMTHAYSNAIIDKVEEALKNGIVGNDDEDW
jgi:hypothetical protein